MENALLVLFLYFLYSHVDRKTTDLFDKYRAHSKTVHQDHSRLISDLDYRNWSPAEERKKNGWLIFKAENDF